MDNLINYGSDEDNGDSDNSLKYHQGMKGSRRLLHEAPHCGGANYSHRSSNQQRGGTTDDGTNYEHVQMDLSEEDEPSKNSVHQRQQQLSPDIDRDRANRPQNRPSGHYDTNKQRDGRENRDDNNPRHNERSRDRDRDQRNRSRDRDQRDRSNHKNTKDDDRDKDRDRSNGGGDDRAPCRSGGRDDRKESRDSRGGGGDRDKRSNGYDRDRDYTRRDNNRDNKDNKFDNRRDRDGSNNKDLATCYNRDKRNSRDNRDNRDRGDRDNKQRDNRRKSPFNQQHCNSYNNFRGGGSGNKRFDRAFNKMVQLEKLGIEIKTPENFVPPASGIYTLDDARGNNGPYLGNSSTSGGGHQIGSSSGGVNLMGGDGQFFMPGVTGRFRDQIERRKQLWAKSKQPEQQTPIQQPAAGITTSPQSSGASQPTGTATWAATTFAQDTDGRQANKFKRLMGIRGEATGKSTSSESSTPNKRQEEMFNSMEAQYEVARTATHTMRGVGLGFTSATQGVYQR